MNDLNAGAVIAAEAVPEIVQPISKLQQCAASSGNDPFLHGCSGGVEGILDPQLAVLEFGFRRCPNLDHGNSAGQLGDALLELFAVVIRIGGLKFAADCGHTITNGLAVIIVGDDCCGFLTDGDATCLAQVFQGDFVESHGLVFADQRSPGQDRDVGEGCLAAFAEGGGSDGCNLKDSAALVHHKGGESFPFHFLGEDQQG